MKNPFARWLWAAFQLAMGLFFLWSALGDRLLRFVASGGREEASYLASMLAIVLLGWTALMALVLIGRHLAGRAAVIATAGVASVLWTAFSGGLLWTLGAFGADGAWLTGAALVAGPLAVGWAGIVMHLRTLKPDAAPPLTSEDLPEPPQLGFRLGVVLLLCVMIMTATLWPMVVSFVQGGWREGGPVLVALFVGLVVLMAGATWLVRRGRKG